LEVII